MEQAVDNTFTPRQRRAFDVAKRAAQQVLDRRFRLIRLVRDVSAKLFNNESSLGRVRQDLSVLTRLVGAWARGEYAAVPWKSVLYAVAALVYFLNPIDMIPDALIGLGFVDDIAVISAVVRAIRNDLNAFVSWEGQGRPQATLPAPGTERDVL